MIPEIALDGRLERSAPRFDARKITGHDRDASGDQSVRRRGWYFRCWIDADRVTSRRELQNGRVHPAKAGADRRVRNSVVDDQYTRGGASCAPRRPVQCRRRPRRGRHVPLKSRSPLLPESCLVAFEEEGLEELVGAGGFVMPRT